MDRHLAGEAVAARLLGLAPQPRGIAEVDRDRVDGLHPRRGGAGKAERARQPVRIEEAAVAVAVGLRAEFGRKVLGSPRQSLEPGARPRLVELFPIIGRDKEQRTHHRGRMRMKTWRRHSATSLLSWL